MGSRWRSTSFLKGRSSQGEQTKIEEVVHVPPEGEWGVRPGRGPDEPPVLPRVSDEYPCRNVSLERPCVAQHIRWVSRKKSVRLPVTQPKVTRVVPQTNPCLGAQWRPLQGILILTVGEWSEESVCNKSERVNPFN